jgi:hypothetical protein
MTNSETSEDGRVTWSDDGSGSKFGQLENVFGSNPDAKQQFINANKSVHQIIFNNRLLNLFGLMDLSDPKRAEEYDWLEGFVAKNVLKIMLDQIKRRTLAGRMLRRMRRIDSNAQGMAVWEVLTIVKDHNRDVLSLHPEAEQIKEAVDGFFEIVKRETGRPLNPDIAVTPAIRTLWVKAYGLGE